LARGAIAVVWLWNLSAAIPMTLWPARYAPGFELSGVVGATLTRSLGLLFLMWLVPYAPALFDPVRYRVCVGVIVAQQMIGLAGELWLLWSLPPGHAALRATAWRFIAFDAAGLVLLALAWRWSRDQGSL